MPSVTTENYLKQIYVLAELAQGEAVPTGQVAKSLGVTPGTATTMVKSLARQGLLSYKARSGVTLTGQGQRAALQVLRKHRIIEYFLAETLSMDWSEVHEEAERLEHAVSERLAQRLDDYLGNPKYDPHGDVIPTASGMVPERHLTPLSEMPAGGSGQVARLSDQDTPFLDFARQNGLTPGKHISVVTVEPAAGCLSVRLGKKPGGPLVTLSLSAGSKLWIDCEG
jgi:DtxR family Mn-dependent transcriptional regulator